METRRVRWTYRVRVVVTCKWWITWLAVLHALSWLAYVLWENGYTASYNLRSQRWQLKQASLFVGPVTLHKGPAAVLTACGPLHPVLPTWPRWKLKERVSKSSRVNTSFSSGLRRTNTTVIFLCTDAERKTQPRKDTPSVGPLWVS